MSSTVVNATFLLHGQLHIPAAAQISANSSSVTVCTHLVCKGKVETQTVQKPLS